MSEPDRPARDADRPAGIGSRHEARERALALLYEAEAKDLSPTAVLAQLAMPAEPYAVELLTGVGEHGDEIDGIIRTHADPSWTLERMPSVDRAVLRLGVFELVWCPDVPTGAAIDEAVSLAKEFSTDEAGRFVNGVLSAVARAHRS